MTEATIVVRFGESAWSEAPNVFVALLNALCSDMDLTELGRLGFQPRFVPLPSQAYYWTPEWQEGEREADEDLKAGRLHHFADVEEGIRFLHGE